MTNLSKQQQLLEQQGLINTHLQYEGRLISVKSERIKDEQNHIHHYDIVLHPGAVVMIPIHENGSIHLVKQWRRAAGDILVELPAGTLEKNEPPLQCAQRELQEEIGYKAKKMTCLGGFFTAPGFCNEYLHLFLAEDLIPSVLPGDDHEKIDPCLLSLEESLEWIETGRIRDAKTICGVYRYLRWIR
jgi:ADP-ribose pyrophosphatase